MKTIRKGYKQTDIGIVPEDWEVVALGSVFTTFPTASYAREELGSGDVKYIHYGDIHTKFKTVVFADKEAIPTISESKARRYAKLKDGDIILADASEDYVGIGKGIEILNCSNINIISGLHTIPLRDKSQNYVIGFHGYICLNKYIKQQFERQAVGTKVYSISYNSIRECLIPIPTKPEQRAIAEVLSDIDSLIEATDKKIIKKRAIKEGAMQQLLTGRKRLAGFAEPWVETKLGCISHIKTGARNGEECVSDGQYPFFVRSQTVQRINSYSFEGEAILIPGEGGIGDIFHYINGRFDYHQRVYKISDFCKDIECKFVFYFLKKYFGNYAIQQTVKATVDSLRLPTFTEFEIRHPKSIKEQQAIAQILTDMDDEIEQIEKERDKYTCLKQGTMQKLLTGQLRLIAENKIDTKQVKHNNKINEAVVVSFLTNEFGTAKYPLSRFRYTKLAYLLHRKHEHIAEGYDKHAAGPYKSENRYSGAENIAIKNGYIQKVVNPLSGKDAFIAGNSIDEAKKYFVQWYGAEMKSWIAQFRYYKNEQLEVLATVDKSICDLSIQNTPISVKSIKEYIASIPQWKAKLEKPYFSDVEIKKAIAKSYCIFNNTIAL